MDESVNHGFAIRPKYHKASKNSAQSYTADVAQKMGVLNVLFCAQCLTLNRFPVIVC